MEDVWTAPNTLTYTRLLIAVSILALGVHLDSPAVFLAGLIISWTADLADGHLARKTSRETLFGAQLDALADRTTVLVVLVGSVVLADGSATSVIAAALVWLQFGTVDHMLFAQFLRFPRFPLWTPDEFHLVDERVWWLNWSMPAKFASGVSVGLAALGGPAAYGAMALALALVVVRLACYSVITQAAEAEKVARVVVEPTRSDRLVGESDRSSMAQFDEELQEAHV
ncbi:MAG TPA: CDP-alcohol phosphatidyltransferase family protein [Thermoleophilaceae bacterium]|nr:CDP-alcohol phosphatidyltransferase family protein [Thermoleophilaceae bacterium]